MDANAAPTLKARTRLWQFNSQCHQQWLANAHAGFGGRPAFIFFSTRTHNHTHTHGVGGTLAHAPGLAPLPCAPHAHALTAPPYSAGTALQRHPAAPFCSAVQPRACTQHAHAAPHQGRAQSTAGHPNWAHTLVTWQTRGSQCPMAPAPLPSTTTHAPVGL
jgi:hypothetical protein